VNNDQVGTGVKFAMKIKKISFVSFQPVSFTGADEDITPERVCAALHVRTWRRTSARRLARSNRRATGSHFVYFDVRGIRGHGEGNESQWGSLSCAPPKLRVGTALMINKETKEWRQCRASGCRTAHERRYRYTLDAARGKIFSNFMMAMALLKNYHRVS